MAEETFQPDIQSQFGGLVTYQPRRTLSKGASPANVNVMFQPGIVRSRDGFAMEMSGMRTVAGLSQYTKKDGNVSKFVFELGGEVSLEDPDGAQLIRQTSTAGYKKSFGPIADATRMTGAMMNGRWFCCLHDGEVGVVEPVFYDDTLQAPASGISPFYRVGPQGPGHAPTLAAAAGGAIPAGDYKGYVSFLTASGYLTQPSPVSVKVTIVAPNQKIDVSAIPIGPNNIIARYIFITVPNGEQAYCVTSKMVIRDNTTTTLTGIDFSVAELVRGVSLDDVRYLSTPPPAAGCCSYNNRLILWGGLSSEFEKLDALGGVNFSFDGGFDVTATPIPLGWTRASGTRGLKQVATNGATGDVYGITHPGPAAPETDSIYIQFSVPPEVVQKNSYFIRFRMRLTTTTPGVSLTGDYGRVELYAMPSATLISAKSIDLETFTDTVFHTFESTYVAPVPAATTDLKVLIKTLFSNVGAAPVVDLVEWGWVSVVSQSEPNTASSIVLASRWDEPESFDGRNGLIRTAIENGEKITCCFPFRGTLYMAKERSLEAASDNGDEPSTWTVDLISNAAGCFGPNAAATADNFSVFAGRSGVYLFSGGVPEKISQEIEPDWSAIPRGYEYQSWVQIDPDKKRVYVGIPAGPSYFPFIAGSPNTPSGDNGCGELFVLDYQEGWEEGQRKWTKWSKSYAVQSDVGESFAYSAARCGLVGISDSGDRCLYLGGSRPSSNSIVYESGQLTGTGGPWKAEIGSEIPAVVTSGIISPYGYTGAWSWQRTTGAADAYWYVTQDLGNVTLSNQYVCMAIWSSNATALGWGAPSPELVVTWGLTEYKTTINVPASYVWEHFYSFFGPFTGTAVGLKVGVRLQYITDAVRFYGGQAYVTSTPVYTGGCSKTSIFAPILPTGSVFRLDPISSLKCDTDQAISASYETAPFSVEIGRSNFERVVARVAGSGTMAGQARLSDGSYTVLSSSVPVPANPGNDIEAQMNIQDTLLGIKVSTNTYDSSFSLEKLAMFYKPSTYTWLRSKG